MADKEKYSPEQQCRYLAEEIWLLYFNKTMQEKGLITEAQRRRITHLIYSRKSSAVQKWNGSSGNREQNTKKLKGE